MTQDRASGCGWASLPRDRRASQHPASDYTLNCDEPPNAPPPASTGYTTTVTTKPVPASEQDPISRVQWEPHLAGACKRLSECFAVSLYDLSEVVLSEAGSRA